MTRSTCQAVSGYLIAFGVICGGLCLGANPPREAATANLATSYGNEASVPRERDRLPTLNRPRGNAGPTLARNATGTTAFPPQGAPATTTSEKRVGLRDQGTEAIARTGSSARSAGSAVGAVPELIRKQPETLWKAWLAVDAVIRENAGRAQPLPQPYLARAEIWSLAGNHEEAVRDLLTATSIARSQRATVVEQARYLTRLQESLEQLVRAPRPEFHGDATAQFTAGLNDYFQGDLTQALRHFESATQLAPEDTVYWYYRALTHKRLGNDRDAARDITVAVSLEKSQAEWLPRTHGRWLGYFTRVQGPLRQWMESYRSAKPLGP